MKTLKSLLIIMTLCFATQTNAQFLKKLGKKAEKAVERTIEKNVEQKAEKETDKAFDSTFNNSSNKKKKNKKSKIPYNPMGSSKAPESTYRFSHKYVMQMGGSKRNTELVYYLNSHGDYIGSTIPSAKSTDMITVMDVRKKTLFMFMNNNGSKQLMAMDMNLEEIVDNAVDETEYSVKPTGKTKTILGYKAKEFETKGKDMHGSIWITEEAGIVFSKAFYNQRAKKGMDKSWMSKIDGLLLEMTMTDTSKRKPKTTTMKCIALEKHKLTIDTSTYKKMM